MLSLRRFLRKISYVGGEGILGVSLFNRRFPWLQTARRPQGRLWATDAGNVRVSPGPWRTLPATKPGVHLENLYLHMPDGTRLNTFLYLPADLTSTKKIPGLLNTMPYRYMPDEDSTYARNDYASIFVDVRGTGGSEGVPTTEYSVEEYEDISLVIDWLSKQPWSNGNIGMYGGSYSACNSLWTAAALKPPALKAIYALCGTDNRYTDDMHYPGGAMLMVDNSWALRMLSSNVLPPAPDFDFQSKASLDRWETPPWLQGFLHHQLDGPFWRRGSVSSDYGQLTVPTFLVGGSLDVYQNFVPRIMKYSKNAVTKGILGTWHHSLEEPGPKIDLRGNLMMRWFDYWLKGRDTGILREPRVSFYMPRWRKQTFRYTGEIPGEWRHLNDWPDTVFEPKERFYLRPNPEYSVNNAMAIEPSPGQGGRLSDQSGPASALLLRYSPATGGFDQSFGPTPAEGFYGLDRRAEDVWGLAFDTPPLREPVEILGFCKARLFVSSTAPIAIWIVRLCDVAPDGTSYLVSRGYLNGTHRNSHSLPEALVPGEVYEISIEMMCTGYMFERDHRIRIVVSNADFPVLWPSPYPMTTALYAGGDRPSHVELPVVPKLSYLCATLPPLPKQSEQRRRNGQRPGQDESWYRLEHDLASGAHTAIINLPDIKISCRVKDDDPASASLEVSGGGTFEVEGTGRQIEVRSEGILRSTKDQFILDMGVTLSKRGKVVRFRRWKDQIKRELV